MKPVSITRFRGINNRLPEDRLGRVARGERDAGLFVRDAVNVDLTEAGTFQRRGGQELFIPATNCRSLFETPTGFFYAAETDLMYFNGVSTKVGDLASPLADVAYTDTPRGVVWSDGFTVNLLVNGVSAPVAPAAPNPVPVVTGSGGGALPAGSYGVSFATVTADGLRSEMTFPQFVSVPEGGAINISAAGHTQRIAVFATTQDGTIFYREADIAVGVTVAVLPIVRGNREAVNHEVMASLPPGSMLGYHRGRLLSARDNYLTYSRPFNLGLYRPAYDYIAFAHPVTLVAPMEQGVFVATEHETFFLPGDDIAQAGVQQRLPFGAVPGTLTRERNKNGAMWFSPRGAVSGEDDGTVALLQDKDIAFSPAQSGASTVREENGLRSFVAALATSGQPAGAVFGSYIDAEVIN